MGLSPAPGFACRPASSTSSLSPPSTTPEQSSLMSNASRKSSTPTAASTSSSPESASKGFPWSSEFISFLTQASSPKPLRGRSRPAFPWLERTHLLSICSWPLYQSPPGGGLRVAEVVALDDGGRKAVHSEQPLAPGILLIAVPFGTVKIVRWENRSEEHWVQFNGRVLDRRRGDTGGDLVRTQVVDSGHDLLLDFDLRSQPPYAHRKPSYGIFLPCVPDTTTCCTCFC